MRVHDFHSPMLTHSLMSSDDFYILLPSLLMFPFPYVDPWFMFYCLSLHTSNPLDLFFQGLVILILCLLISFFHPCVAEI